MTTVFAVAVVLLPIAVSVLMANRARQINRARGRWGMNRQLWLALALFDLTLAAGTSVFLIINGGVLKWAVIIIPSVVVGALFLYKAQSTPDYSGEGGS